MQMDTRAHRPIDGPGHGARVETDEDQGIRRPHSRLKARAGSALGPAATHRPLTATPHNTAVSARRGAPPPSPWPTTSSDHDQVTRRRRRRRRWRRWATAVRRLVGLVEPRRLVLAVLFVYDVTVVVASHSSKLIVSL